MAKRRAAENKRSAFSPLFARATEQEVRELKRRHSTELLRRPGVSGVGVEKDGKNGFILTVHLDSDNPEIVRELPNQLEGHPLRFVVSGPFQKQ